MLAHPVERAQQLSPARAASYPLPASRKTLFDMFPYQYAPVAIYDISEEVQRPVVDAEHLLRGFHLQTSRFHGLMDVPYQPCQLHAVLRTYHPVVAVAPVP